MKKIWKRSGQVAFWLSIPLLHMYLRTSRRTRVLIVRENEAVVVKGWLSSGRWNLPGGGLHFGEHAQKGAVREVREETGIILLPSQLESLGEARFRRYGLRFAYEQFLVELPSKAELVPQRHEIVDLQWLPVDDLNKQNADDDVMSLIRLWKKRS